MVRILSVVVILIYVLQEVLVISVDRHLHERIHGLVYEQMDDLVIVVVRMKTDVVIIVLL